MDLVFVVGLGYIIWNNAFKEMVSINRADDNVTGGGGARQDTARVDLGLTRLYKPEFGRVNLTEGTVGEAMVAKWEGQNRTRRHQYRYAHNSATLDPYTRFGGLKVNGQTMRVVDHKISVGQCGGKARENVGYMFDVNVVEPRYSSSAARRAHLLG